MTPEELAASARHHIACAMRDHDDVPRQLGTVTLHEEQWLTARHAAAVVRHSGGVLVANDVGSGKTFLALAVARALGRLVVVAPAVLRPSWERALVGADMEAVVLGLESLSRCDDRCAIAAPDVVIVDESHHLRNAGTKRYASVATICARARVILLSATPLQNRRADIAAQLALFLGHRALSLTETELAAFVVRRRAGPHGACVPRLDGPHRVAIAHDDDLLGDLLGLPPPLPPADGGDGGALLSYTLVRRWASSQAALIATLERRLAAALAIESALETGRLPTRAELAAWNVADGAMQLAFPELMATSSEEASAASLLVVVRRHAHAVRGLLSRVRGRPDPDVARADALRAIASTHRGEVVIAFSEYAVSVRALGRQLAASAGVAWLTSHGGHTAAGPIPRREILAQLAPDSVVPPAERIAMLITTDVLSEGLDLQRASVVVHIDLPWNPARLEQRVGRVRRLGSPHSRVCVYALAPPASSDRLVRVEQRLREKIRLAQQSIGITGRMLPPVFDVATESDAPSAVELHADAIAAVGKWQASSASTSLAAAPDPPVAAIAADFDGFLAAVSASDHALLVADTGAGPTTDGRTVLEAVLAATGEPVQVARERSDGAARTLADWWNRQRGSDALGSCEQGIGSSRARALARLASIAAHATRHERAYIAARVDLARSAVTTSLSAGSERVLDALVASGLPDVAWLSALVAFAETQTNRRPPEPAASSTSLPLIAMVVFVRRLSTRL